MLIVVKKMKLIVGNMSYKLKDFIKKYQFGGKLMVINKMCNVKTIKGEVDLIIPFGKVEATGLITNTQVHLEELLMSIDVNIIKYGNLSAKEKIDEIANRYGVKTLYLDFSTYDRNTKL